MVRLCQVCRKLDNLNPQLSFHTFPRDEQRRKTWFVLLGFPIDRILPKIAFICSNHFDEDDFVLQHSKILKPMAAPTPVNAVQEMGLKIEPIFAEPLDILSYDEPPNSTNILEDSTSPLRNRHQDVIKQEVDIWESSTTGTGLETEHVIPQMVEERQINVPGPDFRGRLGLTRSTKRGPKAISNLKPEDFISEPVAKEILETIRRTVQTDKTKIKTLQQRIKRLRGRVNSLTKLNQRNMINHSSESSTTIG